MNFKLSGIGLDTSNLINIGIKPGENNKLKYYHTSLRANNDYLLKGAIGNDSVLVVTTECLDRLEETLTAHLGTVRPENCRHADLLLIPSDLTDREQYLDKLSKLNEERIVKNIGISKPSSLKELKADIEILGRHNIFIRWISLDICPLHFNHTIINWCTENNIEIIGFNPFGGHLTAPTLIESFTASYLLSFAAVYSTILFLSSRNIDMSYDEVDYLQDLIGTEVSARYILRKSVNQLVKQPKEIVTADLIVKEGMRVPINFPELLYAPDNTRHNFGKNLPEINIDDWEEDSMVDEILDMCNEYVPMPEDGNALDRLVTIRHSIDVFLTSKFPESKIVVEKLAETLFVFAINTETTTKKHWWSKKVTLLNVRRFALYYDVDTDKITFTEY